MIHITLIHCVALFVVAIALAQPRPGHAAGLYRSTGPDGTVTYSDRPQSVVPETPAPEPTPETPAPAVAAVLFGVGSRLGPGGRAGAGVSGVGAGAGVSGTTDCGRAL